MTCLADATGADDNLCICGVCDRVACPKASCNDENGPFCGTNTGCKYTKDSTPPVEIRLAFVETDTEPPFDCIKVELRGDCNVTVPLVDGLFSINKEPCADAESNSNTKKNEKLNPNVNLLEYGKYDEEEKTCTDLNEFPEGTEVHTSCSKPIYVGQRVSMNLFITASCNAGSGQSVKVCTDKFPPEPCAAVVGQAESTSFGELIKTSDFHSVVKDADNAFVKSKVSASILGVMMMLGLYQWN